MVIDRVWGGQERFASDVFQAWNDLLDGRPVPLEDRRIGHRTVMHPATEEWVWDDVAIDLPSMATELLANPDLFPARLQAPSGPIEWGPASLAEFARYTPADQSIRINALLQSSRIDIEVVRFVLFHELLHLEQEVLGLIPGGTTQAHFHGRGFYDREHRFPRL